jgi:hypothetical protein
MWAFSLLAEEDTSTHREVSSAYSGLPRVCLGAIEMTTCSGELSPLELRRGEVVR